MDNQFNSPFPSGKAQSYNQNNNNGQTMNQENNIGQQGPHNFNNLSNDEKFDLLYQRNLQDRRRILQLEQQVQNDILTIENYSRRISAMENNYVSLLNRFARLSSSVNTGVEPIRPMNRRLTRIEERFGDIEATFLIENIERDRNEYRLTQRAEQLESLISRYRAGLSGGYNPIHDYFGMMGRVDQYGVQVPNLDRNRPDDRFGDHVPMRLDLIHQDDAYQPNVQQQEVEDLTQKIPKELAPVGNVVIREAENQNINNLNNDDLNEDNRELALYIERMFKRD